MQERQTVRRFRLLQLWVTVHLVTVSRRKAPAGEQGLASMWLSMSGTTEAHGVCLSPLHLVHMYKMPAQLTTESIILLLKA